MRSTLPLLALLALSLTGCQQLQQRYEAAQDIHDFLSAVERGDRQGFDAHVDRPALRRQLRAGIGQAIAERAGVSGQAADVINDLLGSNSADQAMDRMISPESFRIVWKNSGVPIKTAPSAWQIAPLLKMIPPDQACVTKAPGAGDCVLTFRDEAGTWKLVAIDVASARLGVERSMRAPPPAT